MIKNHSIKIILGGLVFVVFLILFFGSAYMDSPKTILQENASAIVYCPYCDPLVNVLPADGFNERPLMGEYMGHSDWVITANFSDSMTNCPNPDHPSGPYCEHTGQDWVLAGERGITAGANIYAEANGTVVATDYDSGFGNYVLIRHNDLLNENEIAIWSQYGHLDSSIISVGDQVYRRASNWLCW